MPQWLQIILAVLGPVGFGLGLWAVYLTRKQADKAYEMALETSIVELRKEIGRLNATNGDTNKLLADMLKERRDFHNDLLQSYRDLAQRDGEIGKRDALIARLERELATTKSDLEQTRARISVETGMPVNGTITPMGVICGEPEFCIDDLAQLTRARIWARPIEGVAGSAATGEDVLEEIQRRRHDGTLYRWLLISAEGTPRGIQLADGVKNREWWQPVLEGVQTVMLANCEGQATSDVIAGLVDRVVLFYGERKSADVSAFVYAFWREMAKIDNADRAFRIAVGEVPAIKRWVDIRRS